MPSKSVQGRGPGQDDEHWLLLFVPTHACSPVALSGQMLSVVSSREYDLSFISCLLIFLSLCLPLAAKQESMFTSPSGLLFP